MHYANVNLNITRREAVGVQALAYAYGVCAMLTTASSVKIEEGFRTKVLKPRLTN